MLVTCIMPTRNRRSFVGRAIECFLRQDYEPRELIVLDDGEDAVADCIPEGRGVRYLRCEEPRSVGTKRNVLCAEARGEVILHWDDDDWYPPWRTRVQVEALGAAGSVLCGTATQYFTEPSSGRAWQYRYAGPGAYVTGATLAYRRSFWESHPFASVQIGEDTQFVRASPPGSVIDLAMPSLCVGTIHPGNVSPKSMAGPAWTCIPATVVRALLEGSSSPSLPPTDALMATCIMPTADRRRFVAHAIELFLRQSYANAELVVVDSGTDATRDACRGLDGVRWVLAPKGTTIGSKRNIACERSRGDVIVHWDDDDWYGPDRLRSQLAPIADGRADITGLENRYVLDLADGSFWTTTDALHRRMFVGDVHGGTLAYRRSLLCGGPRYEDVNLAEDAALLTRLLRGGARLERVRNSGIFVYVRHGSNAWRFETGTFLDPAGWSQTAAPPTLSAADVERLQALRQPSPAKRPPPATRPKASAEAWIDCLGSAQVLAPEAPLRFERCIALVATDPYADLLDATLASLARFGGLEGVPIVVFAEESTRETGRVAAGHGAHVLRCRRLRGPAPAIKGVLYSMARAVEARQYLCLDADLLVLDDLAPLFEAHARLESGRVLIAPEASPAPFADLSDALTGIYGATSNDVARLLGPVAEPGAVSPVVNDGLFVADREALVAVDGLLRGADALLEWMRARPDVWWRHKAAFNVALARLGAVAPLEGGYNAQLHVHPAKQGPGGVIWNGSPARVLHFNGGGRRVHAAWKTRVLEARR